MSIDLLIRPRRNRLSSSIRELVEENHLSVSDLVFPLFLVGGINQKIEIPSMPNMFKLSSDLLIEECKRIFELGIKAVMLFPAMDPSLKDPYATESKNPNSLYIQTIYKLKQEVSGLCIITDVAMDPYSIDGHDGLVSESGEILNDETLPILSEMAKVQAGAGADIIAPSDMMDGRVGFIRKKLDECGFINTGIMSYSVKYASAFYGPFRDAVDSAPKKGDKKTYQMNPANCREAIREVLLDIEEGADMIIVKPALPYLDVLRSIKDQVNVPVATYHVSGEYAMLYGAGKNGWLDYKKVVLESLLSCKRAGADMIITYHAREVAQWLCSSGCSS